MSTQFNSKYYLKKELDYLLNKIYLIKTNFELFKDLKLGEEKKYITDNMPFFSQTILLALSKNVFLELSKIIVDKASFKDDENICVAKNIILIKVYLN